MTNILCYGDSNTWGYIPLCPDPKNPRFPRDQRWTGLLQQQLGPEYYIIEEGLGGRTTVFNDPSSPGRNGLDWLYPCMQTHQPLDLIVCMLGSNDTKVMYSAPVIEIANGLEALIKVMQNPFSTNAQVPPALLIVSPILVGEDIQLSWMWGMFDHSSVEKSKGLAAAYRRLARLYGCHFLDAAKFAAPAPGESIHMDSTGHAALATALAEKISSIFPSA